MKTNPSTQPRAVQKNVDNSKHIRLSICKDLHTSNRMYFEQETPNWASPPTTMIRKEGLYLRWWWSQASGAMEGRCSGEVTRCKQTDTGEEDDRGRLCSFLTFFFLQIKTKRIKMSKNFGSTSPVR